MHPTREDLLGGQVCTAYWHWHEWLCFWWWTTNHATNIKYAYWHLFSEKDDAALFSQVMLATVGFIELIACSYIKILDLTDVPKMLRSKLFDLLGRFEGLHVLKLGSGSGGVSDVYQNKFATGIQSMHHLVHFSLMYDCSNEIVRLLSKNCAHSLRALDIEYSVNVTDRSVYHIQKCRHLRELHMFHTGENETYKSSEIMDITGTQFSRHKCRGEGKVDQRAPGTATARPRRLSLRRPWPPGKDGRCRSSGRASAFGRVLVIGGVLFPWCRTDAASGQHVSKHEEGHVPIQQGDRRWLHQRSVPVPEADGASQLGRGVLFWPAQRPALAARRPIADSLFNTCRRDRHWGHLADFDHLY